jgi:hypothetical protein
MIVICVAVNDCFLELHCTVIQLHTSSSSCIRRTHGIVDFVFSHEWSLQFVSNNTELVVQNTEQCDINLSVQHQPSQMDNLGHKFGGGHIG